MNRTEFMFTTSGCYRCRGTHQVAVNDDFRIRSPHADLQLPHPYVYRGSRSERLSSLEARSLNAAPLDTGNYFFILRNIQPFKNRDQFDRYANILRTSFGQTQHTIFDQVRGYYPLGTQFVVLPMDFEFMSAGAIKTDIYRQHD